MARLTCRDSSNFVSRCSKVLSTLPVRPSGTTAARFQISGRPNFRPVGCLPEALAWTGYTYEHTLVFGVSSKAVGLVHVAIRLARQLRFAFGQEELHRPLAQLFVRPRAQGGRDRAVAGVGFAGGKQLVSCWVPSLRQMATGEGRQTKAKEYRWLVRVAPWY